MRQRILGAIGLVWGGAILITKLGSGRAVEGTGAYAAGQAAALVVAVLLVLVGAYYLFRKQPGK